MTTFTWAQRGRARVAPWLVHRWATTVVSLALLAPAVDLLWAALADRLGANPAEALIRQTGDMALRTVLLTLAVTPLREGLGLPGLARFRRVLGVGSFLWAVLHLLTYAWLDMGLDLSDMLQDVVKRPFILVGSLTLVLMTPLALTSFNAAIKRLGAARWKQLHRLAYAIGVLAIVHFFWMRSGKNVLGEVWVHAAVLALLLGWRLRKRWMA